MADVAEHFADDPEAWDLRARLAWQPIGASNASGADQQAHFEVNATL